MLCDTIRNLRQQKGISQVDLAGYLNVTKQSVSNWENNNIQPSVEIIVKLSKYFAVSTDYLLGLDDRKYIEVTGLTDEQLTHIRQIIADMLK